jgi:hypothetical protein
MFVETGNQEAGFGDTLGLPTVADIQRKLEARGITSKQMKPILEELVIKGEVIIPLGLIFVHPAPADEVSRATKAAIPACFSLDQ